MDLKAKEAKTKVENERERIAGLIGKVSFDIKALPNSLPVDFSTFERSLIENGKQRETKSGKKGLGFGVGPRMPLSEMDRWELKVGQWNAHSEKQVDVKKDATPGPMAYSLVANWGCRPTKKETDENKKLPNIFKSTSNGPKINAYYARM